MATILMIFLRISQTLSLWTAHSASGLQKMVGLYD